ncbi:MAG: hypothetical protein H7835_00200 [Magnetococcus sp. XQGC-1]
MRTIKMDDYQQPLFFRLVEEQEAMAHIYDLHKEIIRSKKISSDLEGLLCANSYRNTEGNRRARLRDEKREWHMLRRQATQSRLMMQF